MIEGHATWNGKMASVSILRPCVDYLGRFCQPLPAHEGKVSSALFVGALAKR
jgi:hypothetical protein